LGVTVVFEELGEEGSSHLLALHAGEGLGFLLVAEHPKLHPDAVEDGSADERELHYVTGGVVSVE
jgi:hypothetical protein